MALLFCSPIGSQFFCLFRFGLVLFVCFVFVFFCSYGRAYAVIIFSLSSFFSFACFNGSSVVSFEAKLRVPEAWGYLVVKDLFCLRQSKTC